MERNKLFSDILDAVLIVLTRYHEAEKTEFN